MRTRLVGKTTFLYQMKLGDVVRTTPTIGIGDSSCDCYAQIQFVTVVPGFNVESVEFGRPDNRLVSATTRRLLRRIMGCSYTD